MYEVDILSDSITDDEMEELNNLYQTPIGEIPMERDKGIDMTYLSMPPEAAKSLYSVEIIKKTRQYTNFEVASIDFSSDSEGKITARVVVNRAE